MRNYNRNVVFFYTVTTFAIPAIIFLSILAIRFSDFFSFSDFYSDPELLEYAKSYFFLINLTIVSILLIGFIIWITNRIISDLESDNLTLEIKKIQEELNRRYEFLNSDIRVSLNKLKSEFKNFEDTYISYLDSAKKSKVEIDKIQKKMEEFAENMHENMLGFDSNISKQDKKLEGMKMFMNKSFEEFRREFNKFANTVLAGLRSVVPELLSVYQMVAVNFMLEFGNTPLIKVFVALFSLFIFVIVVLWKSQAISYEKALLLFFILEILILFSGYRQFNELSSLQYFYYGSSIVTFILLFFKTLSEGKEKKKNAQNRQYVGEEL